MGALDIATLVTAISVALTALGIAVRLAVDRAAFKAELHYVRRDIDSILELYKMTPVADMEKRREE